MKHLPLDFWQPIPIQPIPTLAALRDMVLARSTKRMPKWKFRLADDMVVQIQPRPTMPHFKCLAIIRDDADASLLTPGNRWPTDSWSIEFYISGNWHFETRAVAYRRDYPHTDICAVRDRLITTLPIVLDKLRPSTMLKPACLCCGKQLTDPVSMSRWIGPDCFGTSSNDLPWMVSPLPHPGDNHASFEGAGA
jgi:hypothetical protein